jgi:hypothetical protein
MKPVYRPTKRTGNNPGAAFPLNRGGDNVSSGFEFDLPIGAADKLGRDSADQAVTVGPGSIGVSQAGS